MIKFSSQKMLAKTRPLTAAKKIRVQNNPQTFTDEKQRRTITRGFSALTKQSKSKSKTQLSKNTESKNHNHSSKKTDHSKWSTIKYGSEQNKFDARKKFAEIKHVNNFVQGKLDRQSDQTSSK